MLSKTTQKNLFYGSLMDMLDTNDPLIQLVDIFPWSKFGDIPKMLCLNHSIIFKYPPYKI